MESKKPSGKSFNYIDIDSIDNKNQKIRTAKRINTCDAPSRASRAVYDGSILFSLVRPYLKNIALVSNINDDSIASTGFYVATPYEPLDSEYLYLLMTSNYVVNGLNQFMKGDNSPSISKNDLEHWLFPIPPLEEQKRLSFEVSRYINILTEIEVSLS